MLMFMSTQGNLQRGKEKYRLASSHQLGPELSDREVAEEPAGNAGPSRVLGCR